MAGNVFLPTTRQRVFFSLKGEITFIPIPTPVEIPTPEDVFPWRGAPAVGGQFDAAPDNVKDAISWFFDPADWKCAACISHCESGWDPQATHDSRTGDLPPGTSREYSLGIWQINLLGHPEVNEDFARNVWTATQYAAILRKNRGSWADWVSCAASCGCS